MVLNSPHPLGKKLRYRRPDIWENKSKEEIKETLLHIIDTEGIEPFVKGVNQKKSSIDEFLEENEYLLDEPLEDIITKSIKDNIDDIAEYFHNHNAFGATYYIEFDKPICIHTDSDGTKYSENIIAVEFYCGAYNWSENKKDRKDFYKYYYEISIW